MTRSVRKSPSAQRDLAEIAAYIAFDSPSAADRFLLAAEDAFVKLCAMPGMGAIREFADPRLDGLRSWPITRFRNYLIFYRALADGIEIVRVLHGARDIERVLGEP